MTQKEQSPFNNLSAQASAFAVPDGEQATGLWARVMQQLKAWFDALENTDSTPPTNPLADVDDEVDAGHYPGGTAARELDGLSEDALLINPSTGLPMVGNTPAGLDVGGNAWGSLQADGWLGSAGTWASQMLSHIRQDIGSCATEAWKGLSDNLHSLQTHADNGAGCSNDWSSGSDWSCNDWSSSSDWGSTHSSWD